jgi:glyoxylase-like metal-dependent hydrolase (beta-lactamase superfamily II)
MEVIAPLAENLLLEEPEKFWEEFSTGRFHDYAQQSTKILGEAIQVKRWVKGGDVVTSNGATLRVIDTPGYTRGAVSYVAEIDGKKTAFTGDLIYGDGKIFDLYSFQDAIPTAQVGGYHGYGGRLADLLASVRKLQEEKLDLIVPVRGPLIREPGKAL